jgi:hypothetical protein
VLTRSVPVSAWAGLTGLTHSGAVPLSASMPSPKPAAGIRSRLNWTSSATEPRGVENATRLSAARSERLVRR